MRAARAKSDEWLNDPATRESYEGAMEADAAKYADEYDHLQDYDGGPE